MTEPVVADTTKNETTNAVVEIPEYSVHLDAVRGAAALLVFLGHLRLFFLPSLIQARGLVAAASGAKAGNLPVSGAMVPVDPAHEAVMVFFVLSGYLVGGSVIRLIRQGRWSWKRYLIHRTVRLWMVLLPALLLGLLLDTAGTRHFAGKDTVYVTGPRNSGWAPNLQDRMRPATLLGNAFFLQEIQVPPLGTNQPLWSLTNEFWYYLAFPCLALVLMGQRALWKRLLAAAGMGAILLFVGGLISLYFSIWLLGVAAAVVPMKIPARFRVVFTIFALALFAAVNATARVLGSESFIVDLLVGLSFVLLLYCLLHFRAPSRGGPYRTSARFMSKVSYSLYLTHAPVLCLMSAALVGSYRVLSLDRHTIFLLSIVVAVVFAAACLVHFLFEARTDHVRDFLEERL